MSFVTGIVLYVIIWWVVIFAVLPLGIQSPDQKVAGEMPGAPADPQLKRKVIITTLVSALIWVVIFALVNSDIISFREMARGCKMSWYCKIAPEHPVHASYHNTEYGFPVTSERALFERLALEIMQAGLSWEIVLKKRKALNKAFDRFNVNKVAAYGAQDVRRLLGDKTIIRNRLKIKAIITNAQKLVELRKSHKGFAGWLAAHHPLTKSAWVKLFRQTFKFTGGEIVGEFLMSIGYLPGSHREDCPVYKAILKQKPAWKV